MFLSVSGGGLTTVVTADYTGGSKIGEYLRSCPLNPFVAYRLMMAG